MTITMQEKSNRIIVLQGVPASGKSTWARNVVKNTKDYVIVSRDAIRESRGDYWIPEQEKYISTVEEFQIRAALKAGLNVIIDATNLHSKTIAKWNTIAKDTFSSIEFKLFTIGYEEALKRDATRPRPVGEKALKKFFRKYFPEELNKALRCVDKRPILNPNPILPKCIICDIDGTIALNTGRSPFDYARVKEDNCDPRLQQLLNLLASKNYPSSQENNSDMQPPAIIFLSGREDIKDCRADTNSWLRQYFNFDYTLFMRQKGDHRKDGVIKKELYEEHIKNNYDVLCVLDDRNQVVDMWREEGLLCCQVYYGDF